MKGFLDLLAQIDVAQHQEVSMSTPKSKRSRDVKNFECLINYDARSFGSRRGKGKSALAVV
jgi:hypothetical protein